ncbi:MAG: cation transporter [Gammaproteobacteria bacterium]|nr:cation transporter [Gammaproteobacteria bacterium]
MNPTRDITVRYQADGHVRFQLPAELCRPAAARHLVSALRRLEGIYRVDLAPGQRKLSIRYLPHFRSLEEVAQALHAAVNAAAWSEDPAPGTTAAPGGTLRDRLSRLWPVEWLQAKTREAGETAIAMRILARRPDIREKALGWLDEDTLIHVLNDALMLYLIRLHWPLIAQQWIRSPWLHRYEWLATGYMFYLYARSRRPRPAAIGRA